MTDAAVIDYGDVLADATENSQTAKKGGLINNLSIRNKLIGLLVVFGLMPAVILFAILEFQGGSFRIGLSQGLAINAKRMIDVVERNLFERYGDVQAFGLNTAVLDSANWRNPSDDNPLVAAMNGYMTGYGIYQLMVLVSPDGELLAVNTVGPNGDPLDTESLYNRSFADEPWLKEVLAGQFLEGDGLTGTNVTDAHFNPLIDGVYNTSDSYTLIYAAPVKDPDGNVVAVWANYAEFGLVEDIVAEFYKDYAANGQPSTELTLLDENGAIIVDYDPTGQGWTEYPRNRDVIGKVNLAKLGVEAAVAAVNGGAGSLEESFHARKKVYQAAGYAYTDGGYNYPGLGWSALIRSHVDEAYALWNSTILQMIIALAVSAAVVLALGFMVGRAFSKPITTMTGAMAELADGKLDVEVPAKERGDEIGDMAATVQVFKDNALEMKRLEAEQKEAEKRAEEEKRQAMHKLADDFEASLSGVVEGVSSASTELLSSSETMAKAAEVSHQQAESVAATSQQASGNVQTMSSAAEELAGSITEISRQVTESSNISSNAVEEAKKANEMIRGLAEASDRVGEVVTLINEIADQTNLLALNATIEAARAGEAGKGFAVVASEVKTLANQTGKATEEISAQIGGIRDATQDSVKAIEGIADIIARIDEIASSIASAVEQQGAATQEIARNAEQAATGTNEVSSSITQVTEAASETGTAATQIQSAAADLSKQSELLRSEVGKFLSQVRSG